MLHSRQKDHTFSHRLVLCSACTLLHNNPNILNSVAFSLFKNLTKFSKLLFSLNHNGSLSLLSLLYFGQSRKQCFSSSIALQIMTIPCHSRINLEILYSFQVKQVIPWHAILSSNHFEVFNKSMKNQQVWCSQRSHTAETLQQ